MAKYVGAVDQGTTSTRFMVFDHGGKVVGYEQKNMNKSIPNQDGLNMIHWKFGKLLRTLSAAHSRNCTLNQKISRQLV